MNKMKKTLVGLHWIINILHKNNVPFQIIGGLAARVYGATRALEEIHITIPEESFEIIKSQVQPYIIFGPKNFHNKYWDTFLMPK